MADTPAPIDPDRILEHTFTAVRRGYDPLEVQRYLLQIANQLRSGRDREAELRHQLEEADKRTAPIDDLDPAQLARLLGDETARVLEAEEAGELRGVEVVDGRGALVGLLELVAQLGLPVTTGAELVGDLEQVALDLERVVAPTHRGERVLEDAVRIDRRGSVGHRRRWYRRPPGRPVMLDDLGRRAVRSERRPGRPRSPQPTVGDVGSGGSTSSPPPTVASTASAWSRSSTGSMRRPSA